MNEGIFPTQQDVMPWAKVSVLLASATNLQQNILVGGFGFLMEPRIPSVLSTCTKANKQLDFTSGYQLFLSWKSLHYIFPCISFTLCAQSPPEQVPKWSSVLIASAVLVRGRVWGALLFFVVLISAAPAWQNETHKGCICHIWTLGLCVDTNKIGCQFEWKVIVLFNSYCDQQFCWLFPVQRKEVSWNVILFGCGYISVSLLCFEGWKQ